MSDGQGGMPAPTRSLGHYEIIREIGRGGMATVYLARQIALERNVALKELGSFHAGSTDLAQRFVRESRLAGSLNHPNVVTVLEYFEHAGTPYIAMEYVPRGSLRPYVGRLDLASFAGVMEGILAGLAHAESFGIVHRDLKPENIMVTNEGRVKIADFGIAKATQATGQLAFKTATGMTVGTPAYMAPEQIMGQQVGIWTDLYSVGVMAYEHAVGDVPFHDSGAPVAVLMRHVHEEITSVINSNPGIDPQLSDWIDRLLIKDPAKRTQSPAAAWEELEEVVLRLLGPRWRRSARLPENPSLLDPPRPLTPAPFESVQIDTSRGRPPMPDAAAEASESGLHDVETSEPAQRLPSAPTGAPALDAARANATTERPWQQRVTAEAGAERADGTHSASPMSPSSAGRPPAAASVEPENRMATARRDGIGSARTRLIIGAVVAAVVAVVLGFVVGHSGNRVRTKTAGARTLTGKDVSLAVPRRWIVPAVAPRVPGLQFANAIVREDPASGGIMLVGDIPGAGGRSLLTPSFLSRLPRPPATNDPVEVGDGVAYRFRNLSVNGLAGPLTLLVSPTTAGVIGVACLAPAQRPGGFLTACERAAGTLRLSGAKSLALGPSPGYAASLSKAISALRSVGPTANALRKAKTNQDDAKLSRRLSRIEATAASILASARPGPDAATLNGQLVTALRGASAGYQRMSKAAAGQDVSGYDAARQQTGRELTAVRNVLGALRTIGYES